MHRTCRAGACLRKAATPYGNYCAKHASNNARHGHPEQKGVTKGELKPYLRMIAERRAKHPNRPAWKSMENRWKGLVDIADGVIAEANQGKPMYRFNRMAAIEIKKLDNTVETQKIVDVVLAMYLLQELDPRRFRSDEAFWAQLVRRTRGLTKLNMGAWTNSKTGKTKTAAKELPPKAAQAVAFYLREALGVAGVWLADLEKKEEERKRQEVLSFYAELEELA